ncbi:hypothetical protein RRG08_052756 [Elysia crispata]|uniref:Uncharacterized protein n=1 Tax=Elysia crispata TaxID=231223 RepID=A0AAE1EAJ6_9GAST|nr:hypothetical protein RRG08_052756 [Elysia crispata]
MSISKKKKSSESKQVKTFSQKPSLRLVLELSIGPQTSCWMERRASYSLPLEIIIKSVYLEYWDRTVADNRIYCKITKPCHNKSTAGKVMSILGFHTLPWPLEEGQKQRPMPRSSSSNIVCAR